MIEVWNKVDLLKEEDEGSGKERSDEGGLGGGTGQVGRMNRGFLSEEFFKGRASRAVALSVKTGEGLEE